MHKARKKGRRGVRSIAARIMTTFLGSVLAIYGVFAFLTPLPLGFPLVILGMFMIASANPAFRPVIVRMRRRWQWFNKIVITIAPSASASVRDVINETDPDTAAPPGAPEEKT